MRYRIKKIFKRIVKSTLIGVVAVIFVAVGIDAADHYDNLSQSIFGKLINGKAKGPCPDDMVFVSNDKGGICIDKYEASAGDECPYPAPANQDNSRMDIENKNCKPFSKDGVTPWRFISQSQAAVACVKAGKRLASSEEWYQASLGTPDVSDGWNGDDCQLSNNWPTQPGMTGTGKNCISAAGAYDMIGNVWEWVNGEINEGYYKGQKLPETGYVVSVDSSGMVAETGSNQADKNYNEDYFWIKNGIRGIARGGYWDNKSEGGIYSLYLVSPPSFAGTGVGFRCVMDPVKN